MLNSMTSHTPEEVEKAEYDIFMDVVRKRLVDGLPLASPTGGMSAEQIIYTRDQLLIEKELAYREVITRPVKPKTPCPLCGKLSPEDGTCVACLNTYIEESDKWIDEYAK